jgi:hypothetical protein
MHTKMTLTGPRYLEVQLDRTQIIGTIAHSQVIIRLGNHSWRATYLEALNTGVLVGIHEQERTLTDAQMTWLESKQEEVEAFLSGKTDT